MFHAKYLSSSSLGLLEDDFLRFFFRLSWRQRVQFFEQFSRCLSKEHSCEVLTYVKISRKYKQNTIISFNSPALNPYQSNRKQEIDTVMFIPYYTNKQFHTL
jgi:hypothetical protein